VSLDLREELDKETKEEKEERERIKFPPSRNGPAGACLQVVITCGHTPALFFPCNKLFILLPYSFFFFFFLLSSAPPQKSDLISISSTFILAQWSRRFFTDPLPRFPYDQLVFSQISPWWEMDREMSLEGPNRTQKVACTFIITSLSLPFSISSPSSPSSPKVVLTPRLLLPTTTVPLFV